MEPLPDAHTPDVYTLAAQLTYLMVGVLIAAICAWIVTNASREERSRVFVPWLVWSSPIVAVQLLITLIALVFAASGDLPPLILAAVLGQWLPVLMAVVILPGGLILARRGDALRFGKAEWLSMVVGSTILVLAFSLGWAALAGWLFDPQQSTLFDDFGKSAAALAILVPFAILAAPVEEIIFRLGLQGLMQRMAGERRFPMLLALIIPAAVWAMGHAGALTPHGIKEFQIFGVGLVLGLVYRRYGFGACVAVHLGLNCGALALVPLEMMLFPSSSGGLTE